MKKFILIALLAFTLTSCLTTEKCKAQDYIDWVGNPASLNYGALYNWYAASNANFAPAGYHVPTDAEWTTLTTYLGGTAVAGGKLKETGFSHWLSPNTGATNETLFYAFGGGERTSTGTFEYFKFYGNFWSSTEISSTIGYGIIIPKSDVVIYTTTNSKNYGFSVRLIKNNSTNEGDLTDIDGNVYNCVTIGTQCWLASNWKCTTLNDGTAIPNVTNATAWSLLTTMGYVWYNNDIGNK